ncbi:MAG: exodeoxyribonuclease III [Chloroflexi bacterium]|nr:exodeoxyribonuclease III [Chloroflexota bacterium]
MAVIKLVSWNVNGIRAIHRKELFHPVFQIDPDIVCIQETKAHPEQLEEDLTRVDDYYAYFSSAEKKGYSGVAVYTKNTPLSVQHGFGIDRFDKEGRILVVEYPSFTLLNIYFPNGKSGPDRLQYKMDFYDAFLDYAEDLRRLGKNLVICGDVNTAHMEIDLARPKENENVSGFLRIERDWMDKFISKGYLDTFRMFNNQPGCYTWWDYKSMARDRNVGWRIDYFYVNQEFGQNVKNAYIYSEFMGSDHCPIGIDLELTE